MQEADQELRKEQIDVPLGPLAKLNRDIRDAAKDLGDEQAGYLVATYYALQDERKGMNLRTLSLQAQHRPHLVMAHITDLAETLEGQIKWALDQYSKNAPVGQWARSICGIGPVLAAGLMAYVPAVSRTTLLGLTMDDIEDPTRVEAMIRQAAKNEDARKIVDALPKWARKDFSGTISRYKTTPNVAFETEDDGVTILRTRQTVGQIWSYAGLDGDAGRTEAREWKAGKIRPWNANLKVLCWKIGESFVKVSGNPLDVYGKIWRERKDMETARNEAGKYAEKATAILATGKISKTSELRKHLEAGRLSPAHIHARAKRVAVKLFLSHWHEASYVATFGRLPPAPFAFTHLGHGDFIAAPHMHLIPGWEALRATGNA